MVPGRRVKPRVRPIFLYGLALGLAGMLAIAAGIIPAVPVPEPARHLEWREYPVGGMLLSDPLSPDSLGHIPTILIPPGAVLVVPRWVEGEESQEKRDKA